MKLKHKRILAGITACAMMLSSALSPADSIISEIIPSGIITASAIPLQDLTITGDGLVEGTDYTYSSDTLVIKSSKPITVKNTISGTTSDRIEVENGVTANITLAGLNIETSSAAVSLGSGSKVTITLFGENKLKSGDNCAGLQTSGEDTATLTINGSGKLTATGGMNGAGIGGGNRGSGSNITISGGTVNATGFMNGAGIGGGNRGSGSNITISGGTVTATGGNCGAGIGGGDGGSGSNITISGGTVNATGFMNGAGIGGGGDGNGSDITISGGTVTATGGNCGAGIGGGFRGSGSDITISGGTVTATGGMNGAGIGGGGDGNGSDITISGGTVTATGDDFGAGIGGGNGGSGSDITISGGTVNATGGMDGAGIGGGGDGSGSNITISGGSVKAIGENSIGGGLTQPAVTPTLADGTTPVYLMEINNPNGEDITINGKEYPTEHFDDKKIYAYLPTGSRAEANSVTKGETTTHYFYDTANSKWIPALKDIEISITAPTVGSAFPTTASVISPASGINTISASDIVWKKGTETVSGNADYNTAYTVYITLTADTNYQFVTEPTAKVNTKSATLEGTPLADKITVRYTFDTTIKAKLTSITAPTAITGLANGTAKTAAALGLPAAVGIVTEDTNVTSADVTWDVAGSSYDPSVKTEQTFTVNGTVTLPDSIDDNGVSLSTEISVTVNEADKYAVNISNTITNGTVTADVTSTYAGETVILTATPSQCYAVSSVTVTNSGTGTDVAVTAGANNTYTFTMPANAVNVSAAFTLSHKYATDYSKDATGHWYAATCGHDVKDGFAAHVSSGPATEEKAEVCTVCGYEIAPKLEHTHTFATEYSKDATGHWYAATCGHDVKDGFAAHVSSGPATVENAEVCTVCGYEIAPRLDPDPDPDPDPGHIHSYTYCTDEIGHWKVCACGDKIFISAHSFGKGYKCACGYVDEVRKKSIEEEAAIRDMAAALGSTATVICYADGKPVATCNSRKGKDSVKIKLGSDYAGKTFVIKLGKKVIAEGEFDSDGIYVFEDAALGLLYKLYID